MSFKDMEIDSISDYVKLTASEVATIHILSKTPEKQVVHWVNKTRNSCLGKICEHCLNGNKPKSRWLCHVWDRKEKRVKKFEFGTMIAQQIKAIAEMLAENQQSIHDVDIRIKTTGSDLTTEYNVLHVPMNGIIPEDVLAEFSFKEPDESPYND